MNQSLHYDVLIVGAGITGSALAHVLSMVPRPNSKSLRIALLEGSLAKPDRIDSSAEPWAGSMSGKYGCHPGLRPIAERMSL
jgi:2-polyprenyl-6-methoxyphenol hydroxylase-like FAD-dependent oxidoreductase